MKLNLKITLIIALFTFVVIICFTPSTIHIKNDLNKVRKERIVEFKNSLNSIIELKNKVYKSLYFDYTYWDEMVEFSNSGDKTWAKENIDTAMESTDYEYSAVFNQDNKIVYYSQIDNSLVNLEEYFKSLKFQMNEPLFEEYFIEKNNAIIKVYIAPIQPTSDFKRVTKPQGYFVIAKVISKKYIESLENITQQTISLVKNIDNKQQDVWYALNSKDSKPLAYLSIKLKLKSLQKIDRLYIEQLIFIAISSFIVIIFLSYIIYRYIISPLKRIESVIKNEKYIDSINDLLVQKDEIGSISNSVKKQILESQKSKEYESTINGSSIVSKCDVDGRITFINEQFEKISGYSADELIGQTHNVVRHPDSKKELFKELWHTISKEKKPWMGKIKNRRKNGESYYVNAVVSPILDIYGNVQEYISIRTDITDIEKTKIRLKRQYSITSNKFNDVLNLSSQYEEAIDKSSIIIRVSKDKKINYVNDLFTKLTGYSKEDLINKPYSTLSYPLLNQESIEEIFHIVDNEGIWKGQLQAYTKDNKEIHFISTVVSIRDKNDSVIEYIGFRQDITGIVNLHNEIEDTQRELIYKLGEVGESRSQETGNHVKRVAEYSKLLALKYGLSHKEAELLRIASPMHDIGKVAIPDSILNKRGKLTKEEFEIMKTHSMIGYKMLAGSNRDILKAAAIVSKEHHEKWDGTGYPQGLKEEEIHIFGRISSICDVFDALAHERPYKKAWPLEDVLKFLKEQKAKHFEPGLVDLFIDNIDEFLEKKNKFN